LVMRMSTRGRFGLRALLQLAENGEDEPTSVSSLADSMTVSSDYLMQLFVKLRRAGIVESVRGPRGGFKLSRSPAEITVGDIIRALEGPLGVAPCVLPEACYGARGKLKTQGACPHTPYCAARHVWTNLSREIERVLDATDLHQVLEDSRRLYEKVA
jgi:Rrf2 family protein